MSTFIALLQYRIGSPSHISQEEIKGIKIGKEGVQLSFFTEDVILYIVDHKDSTKKTTRTNK